jgi:hypothetical protein
MLCNDSSILWETKRRYVIFKSARLASYLCLDSWSASFVLAVVAHVTHPIKS